MKIFPIQFSFFRRRAVFDAVQIFCLALLIAALPFMPVNAAENTNITHKADPTPVLVFAASSLGPFLDAAHKRFQQQRLDSPPIDFVFGASATLARQIHFGAPADLFISAHQDWIDYINGQKPIDKPVLLGENRLVLATAAKAKPPVQALEWTKENIEKLLGQQGLIIANPQTAPAGQYALEALRQILGYRPQPNQLIIAANAAEARLLTRATGGVAILYASSLKSDKLLVFLDNIPSKKGDEIKYLGLALTDEGRQFLAWLKAREQQSLWRDFGFEPPDAP